MQAYTYTWTLCRRKHTGHIDIGIYIYFSAYRVGGKVKSILSGGSGGRTPRGATHVMRKEKQQIFSIVFMASLLFQLFFNCFHILRKPASRLVAVCERSEKRGCGGEWLTKPFQISFSGWEEGGRMFPLGPPFWWLNTAG